MVIWIKRTVIVFACVLLLSLGYAALVYTKFNWPEYFMSEIDLVIHQREDRRWGGEVNLIPNVFLFGSKVHAVESILKSQNYKFVSPDAVWQPYKDKASDGGRVYLRRTSDFACNLDNYVFTKFDASDQLISATATQHEAGCL